MPIAFRQYEGVGARLFAPVLLGAAGLPPFPDFAFGSIVAGDAESEFVYLQFAPGANVTLNQGDWLAWDNSYFAVQSLLGATVHPVGVSFGVVFFGGRVGDPAAVQGDIWSYAFLAGSVYGIWVQRAGTAIANMTITNANKQVSTSSTPSQLTQITSPVANS